MSRMWTGLPVDFPDIDAPWVGLVSECHDVDRTAFSGHWRCSCGYVGTEMMIGRHMALQGWCSECWGSGSDPYPSLGLCRECGGTGEAPDREEIRLLLLTIREAGR